MITRTNDNNLTVKNIFHLGLLSGSIYTPPLFLDCFGSHSAEIIESIASETNLPIPTGSINDLLNTIIDHDLNHFVIEFCTALPYNFRFDRGGIISGYSLSASTMSNAFFCGKSIDECLEKAITWKQAVLLEQADKERNPLLSD